MKRRTLLRNAVRAAAPVAVAASILAMITPVVAAAQTAQGQGMTQSMPMAAMSGPDVIEGVVRKIDKGAKKITLRHGEMPHLEMPPMTMVFRVQDAALLDGVKVGDKVRFKPQKIDGAFVVVEMQPAN